MRGNWKAESGNLARVACERFRKKTMNGNQDIRIREMFGN